MTRRENMRRRFREATEVQEIKEARRPGSGQQARMSRDEDIDPLDMLSAIADDPDDSRHSWKKEEMSEEELEWERIIEEDAKYLSSGAQAPEMDEDTESIEAFEKEQTKGKERTAGLEDKER